MQTLNNSFRHFFAANLKVPCAQLIMVERMRATNNSDSMFLLGAFMPMVLKCNLEGKLTRHIFAHKYPYSKLYMKTKFINFIARLSFSE